MPTKNTDGPDDLTGLIRESRLGDPEATQELYGFVYEKLKAMARKKRYGWGNNAPLDTTSLVHEFFAKFTKAQKVDCEDRRHFFNLAARMMQQILVNSAKKKMAYKRGGSAKAVELTDTMLVDVRSPESLILVDQLLSKLEDSNAAAAQAFIYRRFAGFTNAEAAHALEVSPSTAKRLFNFATAWLLRALRVEET